MVDESCSTIMRVKRKSLLTARSVYSLVVVDRARGKALLDSLNGTAVFESTSLRTASRVDIGYGIAIVNVKGGVAVVSLNRFEMLPSEEGVTVKPLAWVAGNAFLLGSDGVLYTVADGVLEPYAYCGSAKLVVSRRDVAVFCDSGVVIGKPDNQLLEAVYEAAEAVKGLKTLAVCIPYIYAADEANVYAVEVNGLSLAVKYPPLTGDRFVDVASGNTLSLSQAAGEHTEEGEQCGISVRGYSYLVEKRGVRLVLGVIDPYGTLLDVNCIENCKGVVDVRPGEIVIGVIDPSKPVSVELVARCGKRVLVNAISAAKMLGLGEAYPVTTRFATVLLVRKGPVLAVTDSSWRLIKPGIYVVRGEATVYDSGGGFTVYERPGPLLSLDYNRAALVVRGGLRAVKCRVVGKESEGLVVDGFSALCSVETDRGWSLISPIRVLLDAALHVSNRVAELLELRRNETSNLARSGQSLH